MRDEQMSEENTSAASMEERLIRALEASPAVQIPADFASRVASQLPATRPVSLTPTHYGRNAVLISMVALVVALLALALHNADSSTLGLTVEWILCAQLLSLAVWFGTRHRSLS
jgi:hypothetical protein